MQEDKYLIGWNTFQGHLQETQKELYNEKHFADVTLVSDDMVQIKAHKTILSSASSVFKQLLMMNESTTNQILFLKGVKYEELESLLQFIYLGEANVYEHRIEVFISAAKDLDIKEMTENVMGIEITDTREVETKTLNNPVKFNSKEYSIFQGNTSNLCPECNAVFANNGNMKKHYKSTHGGEKFQCSKCLKEFSQKVNLERHVKNIHLV